MTYCKVSTASNEVQKEQTIQPEVATCYFFTQSSSSDSLFRNSASASQWSATFKNFIVRQRWSAVPLPQFFSVVCSFQSAILLFRYCYFHSSPLYAAVRYSAVRYSTVRYTVVRYSAVAIPQVAILQFAILQSAIPQFAIPSLLFRNSLFRSISIVSFSLYVFGEPALHLSQFSPLLPLTEVSPQPSAIPGGNPLEDWQSAVGWGDAGFEPETAGQQSGTLPLSHHASLKVSVQSII